MVILVQWVAAPLTFVDVYSYNTGRPRKCVRPILTLSKSLSNFRISGTKCFYAVKCLTTGLEKSSTTAGLAESHASGGSVRPSRMKALADESGTILGVS